MLGGDAATFPRSTPRGGKHEVFCSGCGALLLGRGARGPPRSIWNNLPMKLTRLRLLGFKSFVEPTDFLIEPGLTGVVGPNGCGKSNLVEALRWVMGESSHKAMR